jgi:hypothetical protein
MYFINAPTIFQMLFKMLKVFYDPRTLAKIDILGSDFDGMLKAIVPADELLRLYGTTQFLLALLNGGCYVFCFF